MNPAFYRKWLLINNRLIKWNQLRDLRGVPRITAEDAAVAIFNNPIVYEQLREYFGEPTEDMFFVNKK